MPFAKTSEKGRSKNYSPRILSLHKHLKDHHNRDRTRSGRSRGPVADEIVEHRALSYPPLLLRDPRASTSCTFCGEKKHPALTTSRGSHPQAKQTKLDLDLQVPNRHSLCEEAAPCSTGLERSRQVTEEVETLHSSPCQKTRSPSVSQVNSSCKDRRR